MENQNKKPFNFTQIASIDDKLNKIDEPAIKEIIEGSKSKTNDKVEKLISSKTDAINKYDLAPRTIGVKASLETREDEYLKIIAKINKRTKEDQATQYILEGLKRDKKLAIDYLKNLVD